jgi:hypothetical protein
MYYPKFKLKVKNKPVNIFHNCRKVDRGVRGMYVLDADPQHLVKTNDQWTSQELKQKIHSDYKY